jgi:branched-chain amino acid transport system substrate-binding protein
MATPRKVLAALAAATMVLAACGGDADDGGEGDETATGGATETATEAGGETEGGGGEATGEPIKVGAIFDRTGATGDVGSPFGDGVVAYVDWVNANGGIEGRPIELMHADYAYDVAQAEQLYSQYTAEDVVAFSGWGTGDTEALRPKITADEIPFISGSYSEELRDPAETPYNFVVALTYSDQMRIALNHLASQHEGERIEIAVFHHDSPFGLSPVADGEAYIADQGYDMGYQAYAMPGGAPDFFGELSQAQDQGADYIIIQNVSSPAAQLATNVADQGMDATIVCLNWCADEGFVELAGGAADGSLGVPPWTPPTQSDEDLSGVEGWLSDNGQSLEDINLHFTQGWYQFAVMAEAMRQVVAAGEEVTGPAIKTAMEEMEPFDTPVSEPIDFTAEDHAGMDSGVVYQVTDGTWTAVSDAITP